MRRISSVYAECADTLCADLDSHADTVISGKAFRVENYLNLEIKDTETMTVNCCQKIDLVQSEINALKAKFRKFDLLRTEQKRIQRR